MLRDNVRVLSDEVLRLQMERQRQLDELERQAARDAEDSLEMLGWCLVIGLLLTAILLAAYYTGAI